MKPLIFLSLILATIQVNPTSSSTECTNVSFVNDLENISCPNMKPFTLLDPETSLKKSDCLAACCASGLSDWTGICDTYLFNTTDSSCLLGSVAGYDIADCVNVTAPPGTIVGGGMDRISPLVPKHQFYIRSPPRTEPTHSIDLQSSGERASLVVTRRAATALTVFRSTRLASLRLASPRFASLRFARARLTRLEALDRWSTQHARYPRASRRLQQRYATPPPHQRVSGPSHRGRIR